VVGWFALAAFFGSFVEVKGILEMPCNRVLYVRKWKASWRCHPLTDSRTERHDGAFCLSLQNKKKGRQFVFLPSFMGMMSNQEKTFNPFQNSDNNY